MNTGSYDDYATRPLLASDDYATCKELADNLTRLAEEAEINDDACFDATSTFRSRVKEFVTCNLLPYLSEDEVFSSNYWDNFEFSVKEVIKL